MKILLAVDGSKHSLAAAKCLVDHADWYREKEGDPYELAGVNVDIHRLKTAEEELRTRIRSHADDRSQPGTARKRR